MPPACSCVLIEAAACADVRPPASDTATGVVVPSVTVKPEALAGVRDGDLVIVRSVLRAVLVSAARPAPETPTLNAVLELSARIPLPSMLAEMP